MILEMKPLNLAEVSEYIGKEEEKKDLKDFIKKFGGIKKADAEKLSEELKSLDNLKMKEDFIVKIVDTVPVDSEDLQKIFNDVSLDEKEIEDILNIVRNYGK